MLEKMPHVKNPLSVVAMFAGFAEVSGTLILPFLEKGTQVIFIWFLMGFPILLVALFFATLNWNHTVLYAPSDFKDENNFTSLIRASFAAVQIKAQEEVVEAVLEEPQPGEAQSDDVPQPTSQQTSGALPQQTNDAPSPQAVPQFWGLKQRSKLAAEMAISKLELDRNLMLVRNMTPAKRPGLVFDAVALSPERATVVEVKYTVRAAYPTQIIEQIFDRVQKLHVDLMNENRNLRYVDLILVFVTGDEVSDSDHHRLVQRAQNVAQMYPFKVEVLTYRYEELVGIFG